MRKTVQIILSFLPAALLIQACSLDDAEYVSTSELSYAYVTEEGHLTKDDGTLAVPKDGGSLTVRILSNGDVTLRPVEGTLPDWVHIEGPLSFTGDGTLTFTMDPNEGFRRGAALEANRSGVDPLILVLRQEGTEPYLRCPAPFQAVKGSAAAESVFTLETNIPHEDLVVETSYTEEFDGWISATSWTGGGNLQVAVSANNRDHSRKVRLSLSYVDGWQVRHAQDLYLTQASSSDRFGTPAGFAELRSMATEAGVRPDADLTLTGLVVSDWRSANMDENPVLPISEAGDLANTGVPANVRESVMQVVDTTASARTVYLESPDGAYGFRLLFDDPAGNKLSFGTAVTLSLDGLTLIRESNPDRYTLSGVQPSHIIESLPDQPVPVKQKTIAQLTDDDIYTFVSLLNVEFPVKEGSYTDIRENHALWSAVNDAAVSATDSKRYFYMDGYANLLMDDAGDAICVPINMLCRWRKPEDGVPQGAGTASGILAHNQILRYGDAGRYQLRVIDENAFAPLSDGVSSWTLLAGWDKGKTAASYGTGTLVCEKPGATLADEHSYKSRVAATGRTCGISDTYRSLRVNSAISGWYNWAEDGSLTGIHGLIADISTEGLSGSQLSVAFRFYAGRSGTPATFQGFPSHWCVDYSLDGGETWTPARNADRSGKEYVHLRAIATYTLQYGSYKIPTPTRSTLGATPHVFVLPAEVFGQASVRIRIRPYDTVMSTLPSLFTDEMEVSNVTPSTSVQDYVSFQDLFIRYR